MTFAPVAKVPRRKVKLFTRRQLHRAALAARLNAGLGLKYERAAERARDRSVRKTEAAFKDCDVR